MVSKRSKSKIERKKEQIKASIWPKLDNDKLWDRKKSDGWLSVPRAMPLILRIIDSLAPKGKPISATYFDIWCRTYDDSFVIVSKPREMAYYSGFTGERAEGTWASRIRTLDDLGFINVKGGVSRINYILVFNPYLIIKQYYEQGKINTDMYNALQERLIETGADDLQ